MVRALVLHTAIGGAATLAVAVAAACWTPIWTQSGLQGPAAAASRDGLPEPDLGKRLWRVQHGLRQTPGLDRWNGWGLSLNAATLDLSDLFDEMGPSPEHYRGNIEVRAGWPVRCFRTLADHAVGGPDYEPWVDSGMAVRGWGVRATLPPPGTPPVVDFSPLPTGPRGGPWAVIPFQPDPIPLGVNVAFWGVVSKGVFAGTAAVRRRGRLRRGECPGCGYPRPRGQICPECGRA